MFFRKIAPVFKWIIYVTYVLLLLYVVFFGGNDYRNINLFAFEKSINFFPFRGKVEFFTYTGKHYPKDYLYFWLEMFGNLLLLFPIPFFLILGEGKTDTKKVLILCLFISLAIECTQLLLSIGEMDIDDMLLNTLGAALGIKLASLIKRQLFWQRIQSAVS